MIMRLLPVKTVFVLIILFAGFTSAWGQNEQAPLVESEIIYKDWTYPDIRTGEKLNLREFTRGKKLVIVVYYAPWCGNWRFDAPILKRFHEKYGPLGLGIIAVGEYDPLDSLKANLDQLKIPFPAVYESESRGDREKTLHFKYRRSTGDTRKWGSPWYIFLDPSRMERSGDTLVKNTHIVNGEVIEAEGERFIRQHVGLPVENR
jgi:thiol-disulfide isomerase/thioredoxin